MADATVQETKPQELEKVQEAEKPQETKPQGVVVAIDDEADQIDSYGGNCLNCSNHGKVKELNRDGTCPACGFDKSKLYGAF